MFLVCAIGAVIGANFFLHKPEAPPAVSQMGSVTRDEQTGGCDGEMERQGNWEDAADLLPIAKRENTFLSSAFAGYQNRSMEVEINQGSLNNLGLIPLIREVGQLSLKSDPANLPIEIVDSEKKSSFGNTPMTLDNLPAGNYTVRIKRSGWPDYVQQVTVQPNAPVAVEHAFKGVNVTLKSDPAGATIFVGPTELGKTPLTIELPPEPVELVSRIGALAPVSHEVVPDSNDASTVVEFKHEYGTISLTSDRDDAEVSRRRDQPRKITDRRNISTRSTSDRRSSPGSSRPNTGSRCCRRVSVSRWKSISTSRSRAAAAMTQKPDQSDDDSDGDQTTKTRRVSEPGADLPLKRGL